MPQNPHKIVCMLVHQDYFLDGRVMQYVEVLISHGYQVDVLCSKLENPPPQKRQPGTNVYPIPIGHGQAGAGIILLEYILALMFYTIRLTGLYIKKCYPIIHVHNMPDFLVFAALLPKILGAKVILDVHDPMPEFFLSKFGGKRSPAVYLMRLEEKASAAFSNAVITANPIFKRNLVQRGIAAEKITVVANYPDPKIFIRKAPGSDPPARREDFRLIYPGTLAPRYGLDVPIRALVQLREKIPNIHLILIGPYCAYVDELRQLAGSLGVEECLEIRPAIPIDQVPVAMSAADVGIYTARPDAHMDIAIPGKVIEYAVMGIPIVTARLTILEYLFPDDAVLYFPAGNVDEFSARVLDLYRSPELRQNLVTQADVVLAERHSWQKEQDLYIQILQKLSNRS